MTGFSLEAARRLDAADPLADFRARFHLPPARDGAQPIYFCGNSLGLAPRRAAELVREELEDWARLGVEGHVHGRRAWIPYHEQLGQHTAELVGADPIEVVTMNTLTVNLHLMMVSFYRPDAARYKLLIEKPAFPSDRYAAESQVRFHGLDPRAALLEIGPRAGEAVIREEDLAELIEREGPAIALVLLPGVQYYSGQVFDIAGLTALARRHGCAVGWDLAHAAGNIPLCLHDWGPDFAVWCSYKYLNGGPGAIAGCFVHARHAERFDLPRFAGWWGHDKTTRFRMGPRFQPMRGAEGWQLSNPPILAMAPLIASLEIFAAAGMTALREKSVALSGFLQAGLAQRLGERAQSITPAEAAQRGCQISVRIGNAAGHEVYERLAQAGVVCDWREPDVIRAAPVPLYNRFEEVFRFVELLDRITAEPT